MFDLILNIDSEQYKFYKKDLNSRHFIFIYTFDNVPKCKFYKNKINKNYIYIKITSKLRRVDNEISVLNALPQPKTLYIKKDKK